VLFFNWRLLQLPVRLADYVIVHELVHLQEPHHGSEFWSRWGARCRTGGIRKERNCKAGPGSF